MGVVVFDEVTSLSDPTQTAVQIGLRNQRWDKRVFRTVFRQTNVLRGTRFARSFLNFASHCVESRPRDFSSVLRVIR